MDWTIVIIILVVIAVAIHLFIETVYFIRVGICFFLARFVKRKIHILEKCALSGKFDPSKPNEGFEETKIFQEFVQREMLI